MAGFGKHLFDINRPLLGRLPTGYFYLIIVAILCRELGGKRNCCFGP